MYKIKDKYHTQAHTECKQVQCWHLQGGEMVTNNTKVHHKFISYKPCTQKSKCSVSNDIIFGVGEYMTFSSKINVKTFKKLTRLISPSQTPHVKKKN